MFIVTLELGYSLLADRPCFGMLWELSSLLMHGKKLILKNLIFFLIYIWFGSPAVKGLECIPHIEVGAMFLAVVHGRKGS